MAVVATEVPRVSLLAILPIEVIAKIAGHCKNGDKMRFRQAIRALFNGASITFASPLRLRMVVPTTRNAPTFPDFNFLHRCRNITLIIGSGDVFENFKRRIETLGVGHTVEEDETVQGLMQQVTNPNMPREERRQFWLSRLQTYLTQAFPPRANVAGYFLAQFNLYVRGGEHDLPNSRNRLALKWLQYSSKVPTKDLSLMGSACSLVSLYDTSPSFDTNVVQQLLDLVFAFSCTLQPDSDAPSRFSIALNGLLKGKGEMVPTLTTQATRKLASMCATMEGDLVQADNMLSHMGWLPSAAAVGLAFPLDIIGKLFRNARGSYNTQSAAIRVVMHFISVKRIQDALSDVRLTEFVKQRLGAEQRNSLSDARSSVVMLFAVQGVTYRPSTLVRSLNASPAIMNSLVQILNDVTNSSTSNAPTLACRTMYFISDFACKMDGSIIKSSSLIPQLAKLTEKQDMVGHEALRVLARVFSTKWENYHLVDNAITQSKVIKSLLNLTQMDFGCKTTRLLAVHALTSLARIETSHRSSLSILERMHKAHVTQKSLQLLGPKCTIDVAMRNAVFVLLSEMAAFPPARNSIFMENVLLIIEESLADADSVAVTRLMLQLVLKDKVIRSAAVHSPLVVILLTKLDKHPDVPMDCQHIIGILHALASESVDARVALAQMGAVPVLEKYLQRMRADDPAKTQAQALIDWTRAACAIKVDFTVGGIRFRDNRPPAMFWNTASD